MEWQYRPGSIWANEEAGGGGGGGLFIVTYSDPDEQTTLNKTWKEIYDASKQAPVFLLLSTPADEGGTVCSLMSACYISDGYKVDFGEDDAYRLVFIADSENGYPVYVEN